ncbi:transcription initiation factor tfiid subunit tsm1 [Grosmannia clavigera kw1407]|uniref:Transcription initiation factor TFIID subunit 2 n=1 Tax=Grosmannia clavigera (strain kw1407 / UAMH 11150) TaxID=655863 RepID=F0XS54_GROCL|nr:transcription initiation factor tfiid subunit tsm1 [Grosmannia clavigera kw1407]EFW99627.1 transcription initiation factor tfiid subunit tsm1 [Grosmannia clavigera kw1407]
MPGILEKDLRDGLVPDDAQAAAPEAEQPIEEFVVVNQEIFIEVNFREQSVQGESRITIYLINPDDPPDEVALDARQCEIDTAKIRVNGKNVRATYRDPYEALDVPPSWDLAAVNFPVLKNRMKHLLPRRRRDLPVEKREQIGCSPADRSLRVALHPDLPAVYSTQTRPPLPQPGKLKVRLSTVGLQENGGRAEANKAGAASAPAASTTVPDQPTDGLFEIVVPFRTTHIRDGLQFVGVNDNDTRFPHVYTRHSPEPGLAACIFPCIDDFGSRCFWKIHIKCPRTLGDALMQELASHQSSNNAAAAGHELAATTNGHQGQGRPEQGGGHRQLQLTEEDKLLDMTAVCSGNLVGEKVDEVDETKKIMTFEITDHGSAAHHIGFAVGPFEHVDLFSEFRSEEADEKLGASALKIHGYCLPGRQDEVRNTCAAMAHAADEFAMSYGRYPYDSYKVCFVDDMIPDTTPLLSFSLCSNRLLFPEGIEDRDIEVTRKLVHSLAYQYFGAYIVPNQRTELWLTVGIAYYMTDLFLGKLCGNNDYRFRIKTMADRLAEEDRGRPSLHELGTYTFLGDFELDFLVLKAPLVLFILDKRLTKAAGSASASLARVISKIISKANTSGWGDNNNEIISSETFRRVCEKTSQYQLEAFWNQWVLGSGCPWLSIKQRFNRKRLCVEISILQTQEAGSAKPQPIRHEDFWRELVETKYGTYSRKAQRLFTGPMTIRIHEANGTPYEHIVEIREDAAFTGGAKFDIPYNTKYKRLKRNRRHRERAAAAAAADANGEHSEEMIVFSLGDRLDSPEDMAKWDLIDWTEQDEKNMDQESYEWIRIDSDFEWLVKMHTNMPSWMYLSQLQQDRDVAAQQDTLLYLSRIREHAMAATILTRTLYDERYFHGLRTMAASVLSRQAWKASDSHADADGAENGGQETEGSRNGGAGGNAGSSGGDTVVFRGMTQLMRVFREFFCYPDATSRPNDFSDHQRYLVQCAMIEAISKAQYDDKHPREAQRFLLDLLRFNDNSQNSFSDYIYVAKLLVALATSFCSKTGPTGSKKQQQQQQQQQQKDMVLTFDDAMSDEDFDLGADLHRMEVDTEGQQLLEEALAEIERYRRMDEWTGSYQNLWTTAALEGKRLLMQAGVIPVDALEFVRYLQDGTVDVVQLQAFEALVELGLMLRPSILKLLLATMTLHSSPFVRDRLFKLFCRGLAAIAFGELEVPESGGGESGARERQKERESADANDEDNDNGGVIIEQGDAVIRQHQEQHARRESIAAAVRALKEAVGNKEELLKAMWSAVLSTATGSTEKRNLLELLEAMFDGELSLLLTVRQPTMWTVRRRTATSCVLDFRQVPRPLRTTAVVAPEVVVPVMTMPAMVDVKPVSLSSGLSSATPAISAISGSAVISATQLPPPNHKPASTPTAPRTAPPVSARADTNVLASGQRTRLPDLPKKATAPKIKLQTGRTPLGSSSLSAGSRGGGSGVTPTSAGGAAGATSSSGSPMMRKPTVSLQASSVQAPAATAATAAIAPIAPIAPTTAITTTSTATTKASAPAAGSSTVVADSIAVQRRSLGHSHGHGHGPSHGLSHGVNHSHSLSHNLSHGHSRLSDKANSSPANRVRTPLGNGGSSGKRKREMRDEEGSSGGSPRQRKMVKIAVPRSYHYRLSPQASLWLETPRRSGRPMTDGSIRAVGVSGSSGGIFGNRAGTSKSSSKASTPSRMSSPKVTAMAAATASGRIRLSSTPGPDSTASNKANSRPTPPPHSFGGGGGGGGSSSSSKPARKPLPTRPTGAATTPPGNSSTPLGGPATGAAAAAATAAVAAPPAAHKPIFIKFKNKSAS